MSWSILLTKPDGSQETMHFLDGDSLVVEFSTPPLILSGKYAVLKWKLQKEERRAEYWRSKVNAPKFADVDLSAISTEALMREIGSRAELYENH